MARRTSNRPLTIGGLVRAVQDDFPDISISKVRFLETEGLLTPQRTPKGYRLYAAGDVDRLRYILIAQRDRFWPLKVIRDSLDALDRGLTPVDSADGGRPTPPRAAEDPDLPTVAELRETSPLRLTVGELAEAAGTDVATIEALAGYGMVAADASGYFGATALSVAQSAGRLAAYGMEPRHLRTFKTAADREIGLVDQVLTPARGRDRGQDTAEVLRACIGLHTALVRAGLERP